MHSSLMKPIMEEPSKENSSDSSGKSLTFKDQLMTQIDNHSLRNYLRNFMCPPELYQLFDIRYGITTFE